MQELLSTGQLSRVLKVRPHRLHHLIFMGKLFVPLVAGRHVWGRVEASEAARLLFIQDVAILNAVRSLPEFPKSEPAEARG